MPAPAPISAGQRRMLFGLARSHGYDNEALHDLVRHVTGLDSIAALSKNQASRVIGRLQGPQKALPAHRRDLKKIYALWADLGRRGWYAPRNRQKALRGFLEKRFGVSDLKFLTPPAARRVIQALKEIQRRLS